MSARPDAIDPARFEELFAHREWVRRLARTLVGDHASADDVEQEVWVRALRAPPRALRSARAWLGTVARNAAHDSRRSTSRRAAREARTRVRQTSSSAYDVVSRAETHRDLVNRVLALPQPYRSVVLLRFYDGLPPREIGARTDTTGETARKRVQRGVAMLRDGFSDDLHVLLLPLLAGASKLAKGAAVGTKSKSSIALVLLLLLGLTVGAGWMVMSSAGGAGNDPDVAALGASGDAVGTTRKGEYGDDAAVDDSAEDRPGAAGGGSASTENARARERVEIGETAAAEAADEDAEDAAKRRVRGALVFADGSGPVAGAVVYLRPSTGSMVAVRRVVSDATGGFSFDDLDEDAYRLQVGDRMAVDNPPVEFVPHDVSRVRVGTEPLAIDIERGLTIEGVLLDSAGQLITEKVVVRLDGPKGSGLTQGESLRMLRIVNGHLRVPGLRPGNYDMSFRAEYPALGEAAPSVGSTVMEDVAAGTTDLTVRFGPVGRISGRLVDRTGSPIVAKGGWLMATPAGGESGSLGSVWMTFAEDGTFTSLPLDGNRTYDLIAGNFEGFDGGRTNTVVPGATDVLVRLRRSGRITGRIVRADGKTVPIGLYVLAQATDAPSGRPEGSFSFAYSQADGSFALEGLGEFTFRVVAGGGTSDLALVEALNGIQPGATDVIVRVRPGETVTGRLVNAEGGAVRTSRLSALRDDPVQPTPSVTVDSADGDFEFRSLRPGHYRFFALIGEESVLVGDAVAPATDVVLRLPGGKRVSAR